MFATDKTLSHVSLMSSKYTGLREIHHSHQVVVIWGQLNWGSVTFDQLNWGYQSEGGRLKFNDKDFPTSKEEKF